MLLIFDHRNQYVVGLIFMSQLGRLIKINFGFDIKDRILKYNGFGFAVEEVTMKLNEILTKR